MTAPLEPIAAIGSRPIVNKAALKLQAIPIDSPLARLAAAVA